MILGYFDTMPSTHPPQADLSRTVRLAQDQFVATWSQMGSAWGISRSIAEVHALLFITGEAMCTDDVMDRPGISRGSASMSLRALLDWNLLSRSHKRGDRKEYFIAEQDIWTMYRAIVQIRVKREIDPLSASLFEIRDMTADPSHANTPLTDIPQAEPTRAAHNKKLDEMLAFFELMQSLRQRFLNQPHANLPAIAELPLRANP